MIIDKIQNSTYYENLHPRFAKAFDFIKKTDFSKIKDGKYIIENDDIFALAQEYNTKDKDSASLEAHRKYIDIQYIYSGTECIGTSTLEDQTIISNDMEKDIAFYAGDASFIKLESEMFAVFFPHDLHMPGIKFAQSVKVKKVVLKVKL